jgi:hypothetical protein
MLALTRSLLSAAPCPSVVAAACGGWSCGLQKDRYFIAEKPAPAHPAGFASLRIVLGPVPRVSRACDARDADAHPLAALGRPLPVRVCRRLWDNVLKRLESFEEFHLKAKVKICT